ncbi:MAG: hypothetical protein RQ752_15925, partial [Thermohalobaculum sp.]|nr:hypothetical protein [Thermohalobaculum sp.]
AHPRAIRLRRNALPRQVARRPRCAAAAPGEYGNGNGIWHPDALHAPPDAGKTARPSPPGDRKFRGNLAVST